ncbi:4Fe-4S dicluster domain-containing protein, partial [bacterium]|nr:4Fe-4S dicluster domain-containing protein [bacterium]
MKDVIKTEWKEIPKVPVQTSNVFDMTAIIPGTRPVHIAEDIAVPISKLSMALMEIKKISKKYGIPTLIISGDVGRGILHPALLIDVRKKDKFEDAKNLMEEIYNIALRLGGTVSGTHGIGISRIAYLKKEYSRTYLETFQKIKKTLDPNNILNPDKIFSQVKIDPFDELLFKEWWNKSDLSYLNEYKEKLISCDFCAFCNIVCPTFLKTKSHIFSPRGRLILARGLITGEIRVTPKLKESFSSCILCKKCEEKCPKNIPICEIIEKVKENIGV